MMTFVIYKDLVVKAYNGDVNQHIFNDYLGVIRYTQTNKTFTSKTYGFFASKNIKKTVHLWDLEIINESIQLNDFFKIVEFSETGYLPTEKNTYNVRVKVVVQDRFDQKEEFVFYRSPGYALSERDISRYIHEIIDVINKKHAF